MSGSSQKGAARMSPVDRRHTGALDKMVGPVYIAGILFVILPIVDLVTNVIPLQPGDVAWRYGAVGLSSGFLLTPLLGMLVLALGAAYAEHALVLRILAGLGIAGAVVLIGVSVLFTLDALQLRGAVTPAESARFDIGAVKAVGKNVVGAVALGWLGRGSWLAARRAVRTHRARTAEPPSVARSR